MWHCPPRRILVAVDFSQPSEQAVALAGDLAAPLDATLLVVHAEQFELPAYFTSAQTELLRQEQEHARRAALSYAESFVRAATTTHAEVSVVDGTPVDVILESARGADLIVMGTHGRRGPGRWWLGSVAERVVRAATVPVLVVHHTPGSGLRVARDVFAHPVILESTDAALQRGRECAAALAGAFGASATVESARVESCDVNTLVAASLVIAPLPAGVPGGLTPIDSVVRLLRVCQRPVLFVPGLGADAGVGSRAKSTTSGS